MKKYLWMFLVFSLLACYPASQNTNSKEPSDQNSNFPVNISNSSRDLVKVSPIKNEEMEKKTPQNNVSGVIPASSQQEQPEDLDTILETIINKLGEKVAKNQATKEDEINLALLLVIRKRPQEAEKILSNPKFEEGESLPRLIRAYILEKLGARDEAEQILRKVLARLENISGIEVTNISLCKVIYGAGRYEPHPTKELLSGEPALVHITVKKFTLQKLLDSWEIFIRYNWELFDSQGNKITIKKWDQVDEEQKIDRKKFPQQITEFHQYFRFPMPKNLPMGKYKIRITVEDVPTGKKSSGEVELQIAEDYQES